MSVSPVVDDVYGCTSDTTITTDNDVYRRTSEPWDRRLSWDGVGYSYGERRDVDIDDDFTRILQSKKTVAEYFTKPIMVGCLTILVTRPSCNREYRVLK